MSSTHTGLHQDYSEAPLPPITLARLISDSKEAQRIFRSCTPLHPSIIMSRQKLHSQAGAALRFCNKSQLLIT